MRFQRLSASSLRIRRVQRAGSPCVWRKLEVQTPALGIFYFFMDSVAEACTSFARLYI